MTIQRINLNSALKVGAIMGFILGLITGLFVLAFQSYVMALIVNLTVGPSGDFTVSQGSGDAFALLNLTTMCFFYGAYILFSTISGGITGVLLAFAYNLAARMVGGLELELDREKGKRHDEIYE